MRKTAKQKIQQIWRVCSWGLRVTLACNPQTKKINPLRALCILGHTSGNQAAVGRRCVVGFGTGLVLGIYRGPALLGACLGEVPRVVRSWPLFLDQPHVTFLAPLERPPLFRSRFGGVRNRFEIGSKSVRIQIGSKSVQNRFGIGSKSVRGFEIGSKSVRHRFGGSKSVRNRFEIGSKSVRGFEIGSKSV